MKFCSLASSSSGNSYYIGTDNGISVLVDVGVSAKNIEQLLANIGQTAATLSALLITHEHQDHIKGIGTLARRYHLPIYATEGTWAAIDAKIGNLDEAQRIRLPKSSFILGDLTIHYLATKHDANEPVAYILQDKEQKISLLTDTGVLNSEMIGKLYNSDLIAIEANHDETMLFHGRYSYPLKKRISGDYGHLSNRACGQGLLEMIGAKTRHVVLTHLSRENNLPSLAHQCVKDTLLAGHLTGSIKLWVADALGASANIQI